MTVKGNHPLAEIIAKCLFGINIVTSEYRGQMIRKACRKAVEYHECEIAAIKQSLADAVEDLIVYGTHDWDCGVKGLNNNCTCGVIAAIEKYRELAK